MSDHPSVDVVSQGRIRIITLRRTHRRNAVDRATAERLAEAFRQFDADPAVDVAVLAGEENFCAGADLKAFADGHPNRLAPTGDGPMGPSRMVLTKPVIAAIEGFAVAGGLELALWCDLRVAAADATLGVFCRRWGVPLIDGGTVRLPRLIGLGHAMDLILTGRPVQAEEALRIGLVNRVVPPGTTTAEAIKLAAHIASFPQACLRVDRASAHGAFGPIDEAMRAEFEHGVAVLDDARSGAAKFAAGAGRGGTWRSDGGASD